MSVAIRHCVYCNAEMITRSAKKRYCSKNCQQRHKRQLEQATLAALSVSQI